jgi:hypothetical protein
MADYHFFSIFFINDKLVTAVLCFGSFICNQAARIRLIDRNEHQKHLMLLSLSEH